MSRTVTLQSLVADAIDTHYGGTATGLADDLGITLSSFLRGVKLGSLSELTCLRLAEAIGEPPSTILRLSGKAEIAELIERLYGDGPRPLRKEQRDLLAAWARLSPNRRRAFRALLESR